VWYLITNRIGSDYPWIFAVSGLVLLLIYRVIRGRMYCPLLVLGIDVDGVLGDQVPPTLDRIKGKGKGKNLCKDDITSWDHPIDDTDFTKEIEECLLDKDFVMEMPVISGSISALEKLYKVYHLVIATNRPSETEQYTVSWLRKNFKFHEFINTREVGKDSLGLDVLVDDNPENIKSFARTGKKALLFSQPWNKDYSDKEFDRLVREKKIVRCDSWKKTLDFLIEFKKQCEKKS
jgi:5'(3')-deoxyribonucleotidase